MAYLIYHKRESFVNKFMRGYTENERDEVRDAWIKLMQISGNKIEVQEQEHQLAKPELSYYNQEAATIKRTVRKKVPIKSANYMLDSGRQPHLFGSRELILANPMLRRYFGVHMYLSGQLMKVEFRDRHTSLTDRIKMLSSNLYIDPSF
jgi:hypothetical protein